jgi:hypothetical protein
LKHFPRASRLTKLARETGFIERTPRALDLHCFVLSCLFILTQPLCSLSFQAAFMSLCARPLSKQALHKRFKKPQLIVFLQALLADVLGNKDFTAKGSYQHFGRILIQDSTTIALDPKLAKAFPGPANQHNRSQAHLRVQSVLELKSGQLLHFLLSPFTTNDQAHSSRWLEWIEPNDLIIRDLGYFNLKAFAMIEQAGAFFLSRLPFGIRIQCPKTGKTLALKSLLDPAACTDRRVCIGKNLHLRFVAIPVPEDVANERRRKARHNRDKRLAHSPEYYHALGWSILITNADQERLPVSQILNLYRLRWRIESVFKLWKSSCGMRKISSVGPHQAIPMILGMLIFSALVHNQWIPQLEAYLDPPRPLSPTKLIPLTVLLLCLCMLFSRQLPDNFIETIPKLALFESRSRKSSHDLINLIP